MMMMMMMMMINLSRQPRAYITKAAQSIWSRIERDITIGRDDLTIIFSTIMKKVNNKDILILESNRTVTN
jgi:hypothetical protein